tara:strand:- start:672 stop:1976 length:1305 start_codon:yes stop_codon:yes gene_type:complete
MTKKKYALGAIGLGHWFVRLYYALKKYDDLLYLAKGVGVSQLDKNKRKILAECNLSEDDYYVIQSGNELPKEFLDGTDIVQIASPNEFHKDQTIQCLKNGKLVIVEKTLATNKKEFNNILNYIRKNNQENKVLVHLHYLNKMPSRKLMNFIPSVVKKHGKIISAAGTLFEEINAEDIRRGSWLFDPKNGGIFMDLIHPVEVIMKGTNGKFGKCVSAKHYMTNRKMWEKIIKKKWKKSFFKKKWSFLFKSLFLKWYLKQDKKAFFKNSEMYPTGAYAKYVVSGPLYAEGATAAIRVAKGLSHGSDYRGVRLVFEDGAYLDLKFESSYIEKISHKRGSWRLKKKKDEGKIEIFETEEFTGKLAYEYLIEDVIKLTKGGKPSLSLTDIENIFGAVWKFQDKVKNEKILDTKLDLEKFVAKGVERHVDKRAKEKMNPQ